MRGKSFLIACIATILSCAFVYFLAVDILAIPRRTIDSSYEEFLLKATDSMPGRIIISSGSNSIHGMVASLFESHFGRPAINIADNASFPLRHRIYNIGNHLSSGDLIILPLEWKYYREGTSLPKFYVKSILGELGSNSFYYRELPFVEKMRFIFTNLPFSMAMKNIFTLNNFIGHSKARDINKVSTISIRSFYDAIDHGLRGGHNLDDGPFAPGDKATATETCDEYILIRNGEKGFTISREFKKNLKRLSAMVKKTGARVIFTWPVVVGKTGNECYTSEIVKKNLKTYMREIEDEVEKYGFKFIGTPYESRFDSSCFRDTYYHIRHHCAMERTKKIIKLLDEEGITKRAGYSSDNTNSFLKRYVMDLPPSFFRTLKPISVNSPILNREINNYLYLLRGWSLPEAWGVWSIGKKSTIIFPRPEKPFNAIRLRGGYFYGIEKTGVSINGKFMGRFVLIDKVIPIGKEISNSKLIKITLEHENPISAFDIGINKKDRRKMKYGLSAFELISDLNERRR